MASLYNPEIEQFVLASILQYPDVWGDINFLKDTDFGKVNRPIYSVIKQQLDSTPPESVAPIVLAERLKTFGLTVLEGGLIPLDYLDSLKMLSVDKAGTDDLVKSLKKITVKRELCNKCDEIKNDLLHGKDKSFTEMTNLVEKGISSIETAYFKQETSTLLEGLIEENEERGNNPIDATNMGYLGPFPSINKVLGSLSNPGDFTVVGARTGVGKSTLGFFVNMILAEKYNLPVLHIDKAEMTEKQLRARAVCALSNGQVPLWAIYSGEWRLNKEWFKIIREDVWPRVKKLEKNIHFINVGGMKSKEIVSFIRRHYYNKIGRERHLLIHDDYIKGVETLGHNTQEYQSIGYYVNDMKDLVTKDILASVWTSVQNNRTGISQGKQAKDIVDNEGSMSLSDRIIQMATTGFVMRHKVPEEISNEKNLFGNIKLTLVKQREFLGKDYEKMMSLIKMPNGSFAQNYFSLESKKFYFEDKGDLRHMMEVLGNTVDTVNISKDKIKKEDLL